MSADASLTRLPLRDIFIRAVHPPLRDRAFWAVQGMVVIWAIVHIEADLRSFENGILPTGAPIDPLLIPVGYAALRYGLSGSAATAVWAGLLWLPDLLLSDHRGHPDQDLVQIAVVIAVALFVGLEIERAHLEQKRAEAAEAERRAAELHYHQLFETNASPILLVDSDGVVAEANAAAVALWGSTVGSTSERLLGRRGEDLGEGRSPETVRLHTQVGEERDYRLSVSQLGAEANVSLRQLVLEDVTEEYLAESQARAWAGEVLRAQEEERRRIAREIHDDPLQRLLQLARRMEALGSPRYSADGSAWLGGARDELLDVIGHLRDVTRTLHPAGLDQLGLDAALRGMLADIEVEEGLTTELTVTGAVVRGSREAEVGLFRIIQEAVRNVVRHADASHLRVDLTYDDGVVRVIVTDDGRGFDNADAAPLTGGHLGILGMRERAKLLDGRCDVLSAPRQGTIVTATVPLQHEPADRLDGLVRRR
jgi:signal transduction histidine kinase